MRRRVWIIALLVTVPALGLWWKRQGAEVAPSWRTATVERKDVRATVSATGALEPVSTVEVGTQVSGTIQSLSANFNDEVTAGQVIAKLDTDLLSADVASARATLDLRTAELNEAEANLKSAQALQATGAATEQDLLAAKTAQEIARAQRTSARVSLDRAERALRYATITAPISGTIIERDVEEGQTVNAGTSAPRLFLIAGDLEHLQIIANVDEADIGKISEGMPVEFTVAAFDDEVFQGAVRQVRLSATVTDNVTSYPVVVDVQNPGGRLMPGMTATVSFIVATSPGALCVSNPALRFRPDESQLVGGAEPQPTGGGKSGGGGGRPGGEGRGRGAGGPSSLWVPAEGGKLQRLVVSTGLADAACTEVKGEGLSEGQVVVIGEDRSESGDKSASTSPFRSSSSSSSGRPGGPGGGRPGGF